MPPTRRHPRTPTPPPRRPRVAGLRRPADPQRTAPADAPDPAEPATPDPVDAADPAIEETLVVGSVIGDDTDDREPEDDDLAAPKPRPRPAGKRRDAGTTQPDDLAEAEAEAGTAYQDLAEPVPRRASPYALAIVLVVVAVLAAGLAVWFRGEANSARESADVNNAALTDPAAASELVAQLRGALEQVLSYNYTDLERTANAAREHLAGKAPCEYEQLFGEVRKLAPEQKIVVSAQVREIGLVRLEGDRAVLLAFVDQRSTRADQNQTAVSGAQFNVNAERQDGRWKITGFDLLGQPLADGKAAPQC
ncbi:MAG TPA: hypothetical protein VFV67_02945 [Actinophytocola sp.]|uniref:hypothetical protein n=1 Tax=Actinophytocola sp. TaxID=1872138 RepID=UPI002DBD2AA3|nr:hypothetical protein [Actinophytocola sp.]HEU5469584.1 hypothetical protein [Actinophytocola sp.]